MTDDFDLLSPLWRASTLDLQLSERQWELLLGQARRARLLPRVADQLAARGWLEAVPEGPSRYLNSAKFLVERQGHEVFAELSHLRKALQPVHGPVILLKGAAYVLAGLDAARGRVFSDIDLMVNKSQINAAESSLMAAGWISQERDAYNQRYYREWMHEIPPLEHLRRGSVIDLHHSIAPLTSRFKPSADKLIEQAVPVADSGFYVLGRQDMVLHSALHLYMEGEFDHGLRDLLDLRALLLQFSAEDADYWPKLGARTLELGLAEPLFHLLLQMQRLFELKVPQEILASLGAHGPQGWRRVFLQAVLAQNFRPNHPAGENRKNRWARRLLYLRSHWMRMPPQLLLPHLARKAYRRRFPERTV